MRLFVIAALVIAFLAILFALQNTNLVTIQFFIWQYRQSLALVLLGTLALGTGIGLCVSIPALVRRSHRAARLQKQTETLHTLITEKESAIGAEAEKITVLRQNYGELLQALGLIEPITGLLRQDLLAQTAATQLQQMQTAPYPNPEQTLSLLLFQVHVQKTDGHPFDEVLQVTARILQQRAAADTWFYSDGQGKFAATTPNLDVSAATRYGEALQAEVLERLPALLPGSSIEVTVSIGGTIANSQQAIDLPSLIEAAEAALTQAEQRGRNRIRITPAAG